MNRDCDYTDEELTTMLIGALPVQEEAMRCLFRGGQLKRETIGFLLKSGCSPQDAEEAYSEGSRVFFENILKKKFDRGSSAKTYFIGICKNIWLGKKRGAWQRRVSFLEEAVNKDKLHFDTPDKGLELNSLRKFLDKLLSLTGERCRKMYWLEMEGYSRAEVAEMTGQSSEANAKNAAYRCRKRLKEIINNSPELKDMFKNYLHGK